MKIYLAPMAGVTDAAFRIIVREVSGYNELMYSEMISSTGLHYNSQKTIDMLNFTDEELPISVQLFWSGEVTAFACIAYIFHSVLLLSHSAYTCNPGNVVFASKLIVPNIATHFLKRVFFMIV